MLVYCQINNQASLQAGQLFKNHFLYCTKESFITEVHAVKRQWEGLALKRKAASDQGLTLRAHTTFQTLSARSAIALL